MTEILTEEEVSRIILTRRSTAQRAIDDFGRLKASHRALQERCKELEALLLHWKRRHELNEKVENLRIRELEEALGRALEMAGAPPYHD